MRVNTEKQSAMNIGKVFERGRNSFSSLRLGLACAVVFSHAYYLANFGMDPLERLTGLRIGNVAVDGFFALSGMLVTASLLRNAAIGNFIRHRLARLMPGFWACLVVCAFVLAPLTIVADFGWRDLLSITTLRSLMGYVWKNAGLFIAQPELERVLSGLDYRRINPSLWTLAPEACCYAGLAVAATFGLLTKTWRRWTIPVVIVAGLFSASPLAGSIKVGLGEAPQRLVEMGLHFLVGVATVLFLGRLRVTRAIALAFVGAYVVCVYVPSLHFLRSLWLAPALAALAYVIPLHGRGDRTDLSYGIYLYGSALQQVLVWAGWAGGGPLIFFALSLSGTLPLAWLSWTAIEKPALNRLKEQRLASQAELLGASA